MKRIRQAATIFTGLGILISSHLPVGSLSSVSFKSGSFERNSAYGVLASAYAQENSDSEGLTIEGHQSQRPPQTSSGQQPTTPRNAQASDLSLSTPEKRIDYGSVQNSAISKMESFTSALATKSQFSAPSFDEHELNYLAATNLLCSLQNGSCPALLQTLLEIDLVTSQNKSKAQCPNLTGMWQKWVGGEMERRFDYDLQIGNLQKAQTFKTQERPKYVRCTQTIQDILDTTPKNTSIFNTRYGQDSQAHQDARQVVQLLKDIQEKIPNIFGRLGLKSAI